MIKNPWSLLFVCGIVLSALACSSSGNEVLAGATQNPTAPDPPVISPTPQQVTRTPTSTPSPTPSPTATPAPTRTPTLTPTPLGCWTEGGEIQTHLLSTSLSAYPAQFRVYTPPCYKEEPQRRYPLLILIHGSTYNDDQWDRLGIDEQADALIASGEIPPLIILMPRDRVWTEPPNDPFEDILLGDILPWVDETYRTIPERDFRAIGGLSRGASWAVHTGISHWEMFGAIGAHSLPMFVNDPPKLKGWLQDIPVESLPRFFLDIGEKDYLKQYAVSFEELLTELGIPHEWFLFPGRHDEAYWKEHLPQYLRWYTETW